MFVLFFTTYLVFVFGFIFLYFFLICFHQLPKILLIWHHTNHFKVEAIQPCKNWKCKCLKFEILSNITETFFRCIDMELYLKSVVKTLSTHLRATRNDIRFKFTSSLQVKMAHYVSVEKETSKLDSHKLLWTRFYKNYIPRG